MEPNHRIGIIGMGYVGLPLAVEFAKKYPVTGFDINRERIKELMNGHDHTLEVEEAALRNILTDEPTQAGLFCSYNPEDMQACNYFIITVPTPVDQYNHPDLNTIFKASETVGKVLKKGDIVIYESTVYPGATEEECVPVLERISGLKFNVDFFCGYSPERINPGDKLHSITNILKITSGSTPEVAKKVDALYRSIIMAGTYMAPSIKVAEAAKVIENSQRDINIAFINEMAKIFNLLEIDTQAVLDAAGTKWNFQKFKPGLVGGNCISVHPYYLAHKAGQAGYRAEIVLAGRRVNSEMGRYVAGQTIKLMVRKEIPVKGASILILGFTFKENCPDVGNTRVVDIVNELKSHESVVSVYDPWADPKTVYHQYGITTLGTLSSAKFDAVILAVAHDEFNKLDVRNLVSDRHVIYDVKGILDHQIVDGRL